MASRLSDFIEDIDIEDPDYKDRKRIEAELKDIVDDSYSFKHGSKNETLCGTYYRALSNLGLVVDMDDFWYQWDNAVDTDVDEVARYVAQHIFRALKRRGMLGQANKFMGMFNERYKYQYMFRVNYTRDGGIRDVRIKLDVYVHTYIFDTLYRMIGK